MQSDFGEGVARHGGRLYQLTWQSGKTWTYAADDFEDAKETATPLQDGWGIASDGTHLIVGDSSEKLVFLDPETLQEVRSITVTGRSAHAQEWLRWGAASGAAALWCLGADASTAAARGMQCSRVVMACRL